jgi:phospholipid N-methyltransferase
MSTWTFLKDVARRPRQMGAIAPSGTELARLMVEAADVRPGHVVAELGAGTGSITTAICERAPGAHVIALEPGPELAALLRAKCPDVHVCERLAHELPDVLGEWGHPCVDRVLSGLPWTIWPEAEQDAILSAVASVMQPDGRLVTFTYVHSQVLPGAGTLAALLGRHFTTVTKTRTAWKNVPPAFAYVAVQPRVRGGGSSREGVEPRPCA